MTLNLTCEETPITVLKADDDTLPFAVTDENGDAVSVAGATFTFRVLPTQYSANTAKLIEKDEGDMTIDAGEGTGSIPVTAEDKAALDVGAYYYHLHMVESNGTDTTLMRGAFRVVG